MPTFAELVFDVEDGPPPRPECVHPEIGDDPGRVGVVRPAPEEPRIAHLRQLRVGAPDHHRSAGLHHVREQGVHVGAALRGEEGHDLGPGGEPPEGRHGAGRAPFRVLDDHLDGTAEHAARLVDLLGSEPGAVGQLRHRPRPSSHHEAEPDRVRRPRGTRCGEHRGEREDERPGDEWHLAPPFCLRLLRDSSVALDARSTGSPAWLEFPARASAHFRYETVNDC